MITSPAFSVAVNVPNILPGISPPLLVINAISHTLRDVLKTRSWESIDPLLK
jgi:hypothetical protein